MLGFEGFGNVGDVVAVVEILGQRVLAVGGPDLVAGLKALGAQLGRLGQGVNLHARVVVIELAVYLPALGAVQVADGVANGRLAAVAHVQRAGGIGGDELDQNVCATVGLVAKLGTLRQHFAHDLLLGSGLQANVQKAGACNFNSIHPLLEGLASL